MRRCALAIALGLAIAACSSRPHVGVERDRKDAGAPSVVFVDRPAPTRHAPVATPVVPLAPEQEPDDDVAHAQPAPLPQKGIQGTLAAPAGDTRKSDQDVYQWLVNADAPSLARISLSGIAGRTLALDVLDGDGNKISSASDAGAGEAEVVPDLAVTPGQTVFLVVREQGKHAPSPADATQSYQLVAQLSPLGPTDESEPNDTPDRATAMTGNEISGYFGRRHDDDWLKPPAAPPAGAGPQNALRLELTAVDGVAPSLRVYDLAGVKPAASKKGVATAGPVLAEARGGKGEPLRLRNAPYPTGGPLVLARADSGWSSDVRWGLSTGIEPLAPGLEVEPNEQSANASESSLLAAPDVSAVDDAHQARGYLWPGDVDCWRLKAPQGGVVMLAVTPPPSSKVDLRLDILDATSGKPLVKIDDQTAGHGEGHAGWYVPDGGVMVIRVAARARDELFDAPYQLAAAILSDTNLEHEPDDNQQRPTSITPGQPARGWLAPRNDVDWYVVTPPSGATRVQATISSVPSGLSPTIKVYDASHTVVASGTTSASGAAQGGGALFISVTDAAGKANPRDAYTLEVAFP